MSLEAPDPAQGPRRKRSRKVGFLTELYHRIQIYISCERNGIKSMKHFASCVVRTIPTETNLA